MRDSSSPAIYAFWSKLPKLGLWIIIHLHCTWGGTKRTFLILNHDDQGHTQFLRSSQLPGLGFSESRRLLFGIPSSKKSSISSSSLSKKLSLFQPVSISQGPFSRPVIWDLILGHRKAAWGYQIEQPRDESPLIMFIYKYLRFIKLQPARC